MEYLYFSFHMEQLLERIDVPKSNAYIEEVEPLIRVSESL